MDASLRHTDGDLLPRLFTEIDCGTDRRESVASWVNGSGNVAKASTRGGAAVRREMCCRNAPQEGLLFLGCILQQAEALYADLPRLMYAESGEYDESKTKAKP